MAGRGDPPEGVPEAFSGGDDEYRSVVFDESFVRAARIQEFSATERMRSDARAVRRRRGFLRGSVSRQAFALLLLIALAFGTAVYMGIRHPYRDSRRGNPTEVAMTLIPLAPARSASAGGRTVQELLGKSPAAAYRVGKAGIPLPHVRRTDHFSVSQVFQAVAVAKEYLIASSLDPEVVLGRQTRAVRRLLTPGQQAQFDRSVDRPAADGRHEATGWMVRFDPAKVALADQHIRVDGTIQVTETAANELQVTTDHTFVYALQPVVTGAESQHRHPRPQPMLFTVRRELHMRFDRTALRQSEVTLLASAAEAGPQACTADQTEYFQPLFPGTDPAPAAGTTDPFDRHTPVVATCGRLAG
jgi:hypothetical protein